jgi:hypothetical protein
MTKLATSRADREVAREEARSYVGGAFSSTVGDAALAILG